MTIIYDNCKKHPCGNFYINGESCGGCPEYLLQHAHDGHKAFVNEECEHKEQCMKNALNTRGGYLDCSECPVNQKSIMGFYNGFVVTQRNKRDGYVDKTLHIYEKDDHTVNISVDDELNEKYCDITITRADADECYEWLGKALHKR